MPEQALEQPKAIEPKKETAERHGGIAEMKEESQLVVFKLGNEEYGVEIHDVREIIKKGKITRVPNAPAFVEGIINLRGKIVVVINLLKRFGTFDEEQHKGTHIVISEVNENSFGILVDEVSEVLRIAKEDIKKAPGIIASKIHADYLKGVGIVGERLLILLDLPKVLSEKELVEMAELTKGMKAKAEGEREKEEAHKKPGITDEDVEKRFKEHFKEAEKKQPVAKEESFEKKPIKEEHHFVTKFGAKIKSLPELVTTLKNMDEEEFNHHVTPEKNDFSAWIRDVMKDSRLAGKLKKAKTKEEALDILEKA